MGLWTLLEGCLLLANALAILNEDRFLAPRGWSFQEFSGGQEKFIQGTAYWSHICNPVLESSSYDAQLPLHCCEASFWVISPGVL